MKSKWIWIIEIQNKFEMYKIDIWWKMMKNLMF